VCVCVHMRVDGDTGAHILRKRSDLVLAPNPTQAGTLILIGPPP
jgi:hypothetical protein